MLCLLGRDGKQPRVVPEKNGSASLSPIVTLDVPSCSRKDARGMNNVAISPVSLHDPQA